MVNKIRRGLCVALCIVIAAGCVSVKNPNNYRPQTETMSQDYYACSQSSAGTVAAVAWNEYGGYGGVGTKVNSEMLLRCMEARNYRLRRATGGEWAAGLIFLPITTPLALLSGGTFPGDDVRFGGGSAEP